MLKDTDLEGQEPGEDEAEGQAPDAGDAGQAPAAPSNDKWDEETRKYIEKLRTENAKHRTEKKQQEDAATAERQKKLEEDGKFKELLAEQRKATREAQALAQAATLKAEVALLAAKNGVSNPDNIARLTKLVKDDVTWADGSPANLSELVEATLKDIPGLVSKPAATGGAVRNGAKPGAADNSGAGQRTSFSAPGVFKRVTE